MKIVDAQALVESAPADAYVNIERAGRTCYKSEPRIAEGSAEAFVRKIVENGHHSVLEHVSVTVRFVIDRGVSHELVRHRLSSFSQESTRYCNYSQERFGRELTFIRPCFGWHEDSPQFQVWLRAMQRAEEAYFQLLDTGASPQEARSVLPNSLKTEIVVTANFREWRHIFKLRTSPAAHPQMREVMVPLLSWFAGWWPAAFGDIWQSWRNGYVAAGASDGSAAAKERRE